MAENTEQLQIINHGELDSDTKENFNFDLLKKWIDGKSDGVVTHFLTSDKGTLTLASGVTSASLLVIEFEAGELVIINANISKNITSNKWVDMVYAPASLFKDYYGQNDYFTDLDGNSGTHTHVTSDPRRGAFSVFVYGNESGGIKDNTYAYRIFYLQK